MKKFITHVGMDTDSRGFDIAIAEGFGSDNSEVRCWGRIPATLAAVDKLIKQLRRQGYRELRFVYEAGPCGFGLYRQPPSSSFQVARRRKGLTALTCGPLVTRSRRGKSRRGARLRYRTRAEVPRGAAGRGRCPRAKTDSSAQRR